MDTGLENDLRCLLNGKALADILSQCDFTLMDQSIELKTSRGVDTGTCSFIPICKQNVFYIVMAVLFNDKDEVLMMQEAKKECAGTWYLPAGRMNPGENLVDAVRREILEETGINFEPTTLLMIEAARGNWFRFIFTGNLCGGMLKTVSQADSESLQASWVSDQDLNQLSLRGRDILSIIERAKNHLKDKQNYHSPLLPTIQPHSRLLLRLVLVIKKKSNNRLHVLICARDGNHLPTCEINPLRSVHAALKRYVQYIFTDHTPTHRPHGILSVEHSGFPMNEKDGLCLSILVACTEPLEDVTPRENYEWIEIDQDLEHKYLSRLAKNKTLPLSIV